MFIRSRSVFRFMFVSVVVVLLFSFAAPARFEAAVSPEAMAKSVTIYRDNYGVPHVVGPTDASVVFGLMYAQAEDNFWQLEEDHINKLGRASELYGESRLMGDLMTRLFETNAAARAEYEKLSPSIRALCDAYAAGLNFYLERNQQVKPRLITKFEPWFPLITGAPATGSLGVSQQEIRKYFGLGQATTAPDSPTEGEDENAGSNMWAVSSKKSASGNPLLFINPHVAFFGGGQRYEAHLKSGEGLNISGFSMLGMPYIWTGHNAVLGWSHTNTAADSTDLYLETFDSEEDPLKYKVGSEYRKATEWTDEVVVNSKGERSVRSFTFRKTHRGPVVGMRDGKYLVVKAASMEVGPKLFAQKWAMAKSKNLVDFKKALSHRRLTGSNTIYADKDGNIFYLHGNAMPKRNRSLTGQRP
jgi:acyl-homoserine-lactone acylase